MTTSISQLKAPFAYRNFRVLFWAELIQRSGSYVAFTAISLTLSKQAGENPMLFGLLGAMITAPSLILAPLAGTFIKTEQRRSALRLVQLWFALANSVCAALMAYGYQGKIGLLGAALMFGMGLAAAGPTLSAFLRDIIVDDNHLASANSVSWATLNLVVLFGSLIGGILISLLGATACFVCAALANLCAFVILYQLGPNKTRIAVKEISAASSWRSSLLWMRGPLMVVLSFEILNSFAASPHVFQLPPLNDHVLAGTPFTYGLLLAAGSLGGVSGGLLLGLLRLPLSKLMMYMSYCILCIGLCLISLSLSETLWLSMLVLFLLNIATAFLMVCETTFIQTNTTESTRGQVMGFFMMAHIGLIPFGSVLLYGTVGDFVGSLRVFGVAGSLFICAFLLSRLTMLRQVETYENQGV